MQTKFLGQAYTSRSIPLACQTLVNLYFEPESTGESESPGGFFNTPGLLRKASGGGMARGALVAGGYLYTVEGSNVYRIDPSFTKTLIGTLPNSTGLVSMAYNGLQVVIAHVAGWHAWTIASSTFAAVSGAPVDSIIAYQDGYIIFTISGEQFGVTGLKSLGIDPLDFASAEGSPDGLISLLSDHRELWLFGDNTTEIWFNTGAADFPFERSGNAYIEHGCAARRSPCKADNAVLWVGKDDRGAGIAWLARGYTPERISTFALETEWATYGDISDAFTYAYQQEGHTFFVVNFPSADKSWAYDLTTGGWSQRTWRDPATGLYHRQRGATYAYFASRPLVGDWETGHLYHLDLNTYTDDGAAVVRERTWTHIENQNQWINHDELELIGEVGVGTGTLDPQAILQWSDDAGFSWSNEHYASMGKIGETRKRVRWTRLGLARRRVYRVRCADPVKIAWYGANLNPGG